VGAVAKTFEEKGSRPVVNCIDFVSVSESPVIVKRYAAVKFK